MLIYELFTVNYHIQFINTLSTNQTTLIPVLQTVYSEHSFYFRLQTEQLV